MVLMTELTAEEKLRIAEEEIVELLGIIEDVQVDSLEAVHEIYPIYMKARQIRELMKFGWRVI